MKFALRAPLKETNDRDGRRDERRVPRCTRGRRDGWKRSSWRRAMKSGLAKEERRGTIRLILDWGIRDLLAAAMLAAGAAKLVGATPMIMTFDKIGIDRWLQPLTGGLEIAAAMLIFPRTAVYGAVLLICVMPGRFSRMSQLLVAVPFPRYSHLPGSGDRAACLQRGSRRVAFSSRSFLIYPPIRLGLNAHRPTEENLAGNRPLLRALPRRRNARFPEYAPVAGR